MTMISSPNETDTDLNTEKLSDELKNAFVSWLETSTSHGLPNIARTKNFAVKILWGIFFIGGLVACGYFFITALINYFKYQPVVQIAVVQEYPTKFPAVTICNLNPFNLENTFAANFIDNLLAANNLSYINKVNSTDNIEDYFGYSSIYEVITDVTDNLKRLIASNENITFSDRRSLGFDLDGDMLISCTFNKESCDYTNFSQFFNYNYGNCYTFNSGKNYSSEEQPILKTSKVGNEYGLQLELMVGNPLTQVKYTPKTGIYLVVHNQSMQSIEIGNGDGINIATGFDTYVSIKREFRSKLDKPYSNCVKNLDTFDSDYAEKLFDYMKNLNISSYNQVFCYNMCYQDKLIDNCNCSDVKYPKIKGEKYCVLGDELTCLENFDKFFSISDIEIVCEHACPIGCETILYQVTSSVATYPTYYYANLLKSKKWFLSNLPLTDSTISTYTRESLLKVTVNYNDLSYTHIEEVPATTVDALVGNVGGQFGLFIGISLLSVIEIIEILIEFVKIIYLKHQIRKINVRPV